MGILVRICSNAAKDDLDISHNFESDFCGTREFLGDLVAKGLSPRIGETFYFSSIDYHRWTLDARKLFNELYLIKIENGVVVKNITYRPKENKSVEVTFYVESVKQNKRKL